MFKLQALQADGITWYTISTHATKWDAIEEMESRPAFKRRAVKYRIVF